MRSNDCLPICVNVLKVLKKLHLPSSETLYFIRLYVTPLLSSVTEPFCPSSPTAVPSYQAIWRRQLSECTDNRFISPFLAGPYGWHTITKYPLSFRPPRPPHNPRGQLLTGWFGQAEMPPLKGTWLMCRVSKERLATCHFFNLALKKKKKKRQTFKTNTNGKRRFQWLTNSTTEGEKSHHDDSRA